MTANLPVLTAYVITDGRAGINAQALGLANALADTMAHAYALHILPIVINHGAAFKAASPSVQFAMTSKLADYGIRADGAAAHFAIGCGRQAIAPLLALKKHSPKTMTVYIQDPRIKSNKFDLVIAPQHDGLAGDNVVSMVGAPNRVTQSHIIGQTLSFSERLAALPMPRAAMLIGGGSGTHKYTEPDLSAHMDAAKTLRRSGMSLLITTSRRTPDFARAAFDRLAKRHDNIWLHDGGAETSGPNPYFAFLGGADLILVTQDSTNMLTEACSTGKPVFTLHMSPKIKHRKFGNGKSENWKFGNGKFQQLYKALNLRCHVEPYAGQLSGRAYEPLRETQRVAAIVWTRYRFLNAET